MTDPGGVEVLRPANRDSASVAPGLSPFAPTLAAAEATSSALTGPAPPRSQAFPGSAKTLRARARGSLGRRLVGRLIDRASRASGRPAGYSPARLAPWRWRWRFEKLPRRERRRRDIASARIRRGVDGDK